MRIFETTALREQYRFPRSKKKRIRRKWRKLAKNWRPITNRGFLAPGNTLVCHPIFAAQLRREFNTQSNQLPQHLA